MFKQRNNIAKPNLENIFVCLHVHRHACLFTCVDAQTCVRTLCVCVCLRLCVCHLCTVHNYTSLGLYHQNCVCCFFVKPLNPYLMIELLERERSFLSHNLFMPTGFVKQIEKHLFYWLLQRDLSRIAVLCTKIKQRNVFGDVGTAFTDVLGQSRACRLAILSMQV